MEEGNNIKSFSAADIERYHKGLMTAQEMHALEKAALDDPFLADAVEGYTLAGVNTTADISELKKRLAEKTKTAEVVIMNKRTNYSWMKVAAMIIVLLGGGLLAYNLINKDNKEIAAFTKDKNQNETAVQNDSAVKKITPVLTDSLSDNYPAVTANPEKVLSNDTKLKLTTSDSIKNLPSYIFKDTSGANVSLANTTKDFGTVQPSPSAGAVKTETRNGDLVISDKKEVEVKSSQRSDNALDREALKQKEGFSKKVAARDEIGVDDKANSKQVQINSGFGEYKSKANRNDSANFNNRYNVFRGRVTDAANNGIPFANLTIPEANVGTYSDSKGYFNLIALDTVLNINTRAIGFNNSQFQLRNNLPASQVNQVVLQEDQSIHAIVMSTKKPNAGRSRSSQMVLTEPEPDDGWEKYDNYLVNNMKIPEEKEILEKGGEVEVSFDVNSKGDPVNIKVTKSLCKECDEEAVRLIKEGPKWKRKNKKEKAKVTVAF
jgi:hypothetical protein